jgi:hypothetical protein
MITNEIVAIRNGINEVNLIIDNFLLDINKGIINDLEGLDDRVNLLCAKVSELPASEFEDLRPDFENALYKVIELKSFLSEELENTNNRVNWQSLSIQTPKAHKPAANDNRYNS